SRRAPGRPPTPPAPRPRGTGPTLPAPGSRRGRAPGAVPSDRPRLPRPPPRREERSQLGELQLAPREEPLARTREERRARADVRRRRRWEPAPSGARPPAGSGRPGGRRAPPGRRRPEATRGAAGPPRPSGGAPAAGRGRADPPEGAAPAGRSLEVGGPVVEGPVVDGAEPGPLAAEGPGGALPRGARAPFR